MTILQAKNKFINFLEKNSSLAIFSLTLLVGVFAFFYYGKWPIQGDALGQYNRALLLKQNFGALLHNPDIGMLEPLNYIIHALLFLLPGNDVYTVYIFNIILFGLTGLLIFKIASLYLNNKKLAFIVFLLFILNHKYWIFILHFKPDIRIVFLFILLIYLTYNIYKKAGITNYWVGWGITAALLLLLDMRYLPHIGLIGLFFMIKLSHFKIYRKNFLTGVIALIIVLAPWLIRQYTVFKEPILISEFKTWMIHKAFNTPKYQKLDKTYKQIGSPELTAIDSVLKQKNITGSKAIFLKSRIKSTQSSKKEKILEKRIDELIAKGYDSNAIYDLIQKGQQRSSIHNFLEGFFYMWKPFQLNLQYLDIKTKKLVEPWSLFGNINGILTKGLIAPFFLVGLIIVGKRKDYWGILIIVLLFVHTFIHALTYVNPRYLFPLLPLYSMIAARGLIYLIYIPKIKRLLKPKKQ